MDTRKLTLQAPDTDSTDWRIVDEQGNHICRHPLPSMSIGGTEQDAAELVRRWNAHPALVEALEGLLKAVRKANSHAERADGYADEDAHFVGEWIDAASATLEAAK